MTPKSVNKADSLTYSNSLVRASTVKESTVPTTARDGKAQSNSPTKVMATSTSISQPLQDFKPQPKKQASFEDLADDWDNFDF